MPSDGNSTETHMSLPERLLLVFMGATMAIDA
jgi:hypothetical protein